MKIHIASASASVARTLESLLQSAGHEIVNAAQAELVVQDMHHPKLAPSNSLKISLTSAEKAVSGDLACPIRPTQLLQHLKTRGTITSVDLPGGWRIDLAARSLQHEDEAAIALTEKETTLLKVLAESMPNALDRETLLTQVWGIGSDVDTHTLETHIYRLRSKLSHLPCELITTAGAYKLTEKLG